MSFRRAGRLEAEILENGALLLPMLREQLRAVLQTAGNTHWGTWTDINLLANSLNIGFVVFSNANLGDGQYIYGLNATRADYPWWVSLYCANNTHFQLAAVHHQQDQRSRVFWPVLGMPDTFRREYNRSNGNCPIGQCYAGGIA